MTYIAALALLITFLSACKKDGGTNPTPEPTYRVKKIQNGAEYKNFTYDNQNRVTSIGFNTGSYRFTYSPNEITVQTYAADGTPDPNWKYVFTTINSCIKKGSRYLSNGAVGRDYFYEYDNDGRLWTTVMSLKDFTGDEMEDHRYYFSYDAQNNLSKVAYTRDNWIGNNLVKADSVSASLSYYTEKPFITWKQVGFDFFGAASGGIQLTGLEVIPFSFLFLENIILSGKAARSIDAKKYKWNPATTSWSPASENNKTYPETDYGYNNEGLLVNDKTMTIEWEVY